MGELSKLLNIGPEVERQLRAVAVENETKNAANTGCIREAFCELWRKIRK